MRKIIVSEFMTLDGVVEEPVWTIPFNTDEQNEHKFQELKTCDALLLGRKTYEGFAEAWPKTAISNTVKNEIRDFAIPDGFAERMNSYPKHVVSRTLRPEDMKWNASLIEGDLTGEVRKLKEQPGRDILVVGSFALVDTLIKLDLLDELRIMVFPVVVGQGMRLFKDDTVIEALKLVDTIVLQSGAVELHYVPANRA